MTPMPNLKPLLATMILMVSGCDRSSPALEEVDPNAPDTVSCQTAGAGKPEPVCRAEVKGDLLTIRHPDGGFRRFRIVKDGRGLIAADGAEPARVTIAQGNRIDVQAGSDRYFLPATIAAP